MSLLYIPLCINPTSIMTLPYPLDQDLHKLESTLLEDTFKKLQLIWPMIIEKKISKNVTVFQRTLIISAFTKLSSLHPSMLVIQTGLVVLWQNVKQLRTEWHLKKSVEKPFLSLYLLFCLRVCDLSDLLLLSTIQLNNRYTIATLSRLSISECIQQSHI